MAKTPNPYAMTAARKAAWIAAGIPGAENLKVVDDPDDPDDPDDDDDPDDEDDPDEPDEDDPDDDDEDDPDEPIPEPIPQVPSVNYGPDGTGGGSSSIPTGGGDDTLAGPTTGADTGDDTPPGPPRVIGISDPERTGGGGLAGGGAGGGRGGGGRSSPGDWQDMIREGYDFGPGMDLGGGSSSGGGGGGVPASGGGRGVTNQGAEDARLRRQRQEYLEDLKNYRTLDLPGEAVSGVNRLVESYNTAYGEARGANEARYQQLLGITDQTTGQRAADIRREGVEERSDLQQGLARTGLANTTVSPTLTVGSKRREQESLNRLADQMQGTKLGIIERREDQYPDAASMQAALSGLGEGYGGAGVSALYNALGNVQQGGSGGGSAAPAAGGAGLHGAPSRQPAGAPLNETGLGPAMPGVPGLPALPGSESFGADQFTMPGAPTVKRKGGNVFGTL